MKKRFIDCDKWDDPWFRRLPSEYKTLWDFILCKCDNSGVWKVDFELAKFLTNAMTIDNETALIIFNESKERVREFKKGYWFIVDFVSFQFGGFEGNNNFHRQIRQLLEKHGLSDFQPQTSPRPAPLEKDKDKEEVKVKEGGVGETNFFNQVTAFEEFWNEYPAKGRLQRSESLRVWCEIVVRREESLRIRTALTKYSAHLKANSDWGKQPKSCSKWLMEWDDWEHHKEPEPEGKKIIKKDPKPRADCSACGGAGKLPDGVKCWCWS